MAGAECGSAEARLVMSSSTTSSVWFITGAGRGMGVDIAQALSSAIYFSPFLPAVVWAEGTRATGVAWASVRECHPNRVREGWCGRLGNVERASMAA